ncbi:MAG: hypothetical protein H8D22_05590 [Candidatus Cloacimonetes bacterium]|nr:hypothetical protein [Candidatus Cloacimonadota bacterium]
MILAIFSILLAWILHKILLYFEIILPWYFESPSVIFFYSLLFSVFDRFCWKLKILQKLYLIKTPNLSGKWQGFIQSSFDEHSLKIEATLEFFQSWSKIKILLSTAQSTSFSELASIVIDTPEGIFLSYQYINEPKSNATNTMHIHRGTVRLILKDKTIIGEYYSGRDRKNLGILNFHRG